MQCHGGVAAAGQTANAAPPRSTKGATVTSDLGVGAHQMHLQPGSLIRAPIACDECHVVPATTYDANGKAHFGKPRAAVTFGALATTGGATAAWSFGSATCSSVYCHGDTLGHGGTATRPIWTTVDGSQTTCSSCHGFPPGGSHPNSTSCSSCHPGTVRPDGTIVIGDATTPGLHINGRLDVVGGGACNGCHGNPTGTVFPLAAAPPVDHLGRTLTTLVTVGAHQQHLVTGTIRNALACTECHRVPSTVGDHDTSGIPATLEFGPLATSGGASPIWTRGSATCASTYCHGSTLVAGGTAVTPQWTRVDGTQRSCGSCHGFPPPSPHPVVAGPVTAAACNACHSQTVTAAGAIDLAGGQHINGSLQVDNLACNACHGNAAAVPAPTPGSPLAAAPPRDHLQNVDTTFVGVGAHQQHLVTGAIREALACDECHTVPASVAAHDVSGLPATLVFNTLATAGGASPIWTRASATCASTYCHGSTLAAGGANVTPQWTRVDGSQSSCGSCHGFPPPSPHPAVAAPVAAAACNACHSQTVLSNGLIDVLGGNHINGSLQLDNLACNACHGDPAASPPPSQALPVGAAPPVDHLGNVATTFVTVGAHQQHVRGGAIRAAVACDECHTVPATLVDHDTSGLPATLTWGPLATRGGASPVWARGAATCASTYCHGSTLGAGGTTVTPQWTKLDGTQIGCGACHGFPPPAPHPVVAAPVTSAACNACHSQTVTAAGAIDLAGGFHVNGSLNVDNMACNACHGDAAAVPAPTPGSPLAAAPPRDHLQNVATTFVGVGAHRQHLVSGTIRAALACTECHTVPANVAAHDVSGLPATLSWGPLATTDGAAPVWTRGSATCASTYCHGATLAAGGLATTPVWTTVNGSQRACTSCHGFPPPAPHPFVDTAAGNVSCRRCHSATVTAAGAIDVVGGQHVNGSLQVDTLACNTCHGSAANPAPPVDVRGVSLASSVTVGAHQQHLLGGAVRSAMACDECHVVPATAPAHDMSGSPAALTFGTLARSGGASPIWSRGSATCASTYCHGATLAAGGATTAPRWTTVDGTQVACGSCHGFPPPAPHPFVTAPVTSAACNACHSQTVTAGGAIDLAGGKHVDGTVQIDNLACNVCHGNPAGNASLETDIAPPRDTSGRSLTSLVTVGAHQSHLRDSAIRLAIACTECHVKPAAVAGHNTGPTATLTFGLLASRGGAPSWDRNAATCSNVYCHGDTINHGGSLTKPQWTKVDGTQAACGTCHGFPPPAPHPVVDVTGGASACNVCHPATITAAGAIDVAGGNHINGRLDVSGAGACNGCHWPGPSTGVVGFAPPAAHTVHATPPALGDVAYGDQSITEQVDPTGATGKYYFGCGFCHPASDANHVNGTVNVDLSPASGVPGGLKSRNAVTAAYDKATGTCSGVSCHSNGLATAPTFAVTPGWTSGVTLACNGCHGDPPTYANGGPGSATANNHLGLDVKGWEYGHVFGLPGSTHQSKHGQPSVYFDPAAGKFVEQRAAVMTCQTCHFDTVDPANVKPGGTFYLDTAITTALPGGDNTRQATNAWKDLQCVSCHAGTGTPAPVGVGAVRALRHVNGKRDVVFDPRTTLPLNYLNGNLGAYTPTRPYFFTDFNDLIVPSLPAGAVIDGPLPGTFSATLAGAGYDAVSQTCSSVACHLQQVSVRWGDKAFETPAAGTTSSFQTASCNACHPLP